VVRRYDTNLAHLTQTCLRYACNYVVRTNLARLMQTCLRYACILCRTFWHDAKYDILYVVLCPRSVTEFYGGIVFFPLYQARKYVLTSWYCPRVVNPSSGLGGLEGRQKMSVILSVCLSVCLFVCPRLPGPGRQSPDFSPQSFSVPP
jgi:hypothetical protein